MRRVSKNGRAYSQGSHKELGDFPRVCTGCGERVRITKDFMTQQSVGGVKTSWHTACWLQSKGVEPIWKPAT